MSFDERPLVATYGLLVCLPMRLLAETGMLLLALEPALSERLEGHSSWDKDWLNELLHRSCSAVLLPSARLAKKEALEAVMGVLGVLCPWCPFFGGGVRPSESEVVPVCKAFTLALVGVLKGSKFNGGKRSGARSFFLKLDDDALFSNM